MTKKSITSKELERFFQACIRLEHFIEPHAEAIASIVTAGDIAVVVYEPGAADKKRARVLGWDGADAVFRMEPSKRKWLASASRYLGDLVRARWLRTRRRGRVFAIITGGTLLINVDKRGRLSIAPGSMDIALRRDKP